VNNIDDFNREIEELRRIMRLFGQDTTDSSDRLKNFTKGLRDSVLDMASATGSFVNSVGRGSTKFNNLNTVVDSAAGTLGKLARAIPYVGAIVDQGVKATATATKFVIDQLDEVGDIFTDLGRVGALTATNIEGIGEQFVQSGQSLQSFRKTILENSVTFAQFGGIVSTGSTTFFKAVGKLANPASTLGDSMRKLGLNTDDIVESGAAYARQQVLLGRNQLITEQSLTDGTKNLALEMDRLSKITGANAKQLREQREAELREGIFGASIREMERAGQGELAKQIQNTSQALGTLVSADAAQGFRDLMSGFPGTAEAVKLIQSTGGEAQRVIDDLQSGRINDIQALQRLSGSAKNFETVVDRFARVGGDASGVYLRATDQTRLANLAIKDQTDLENQLTTIREAQQGEQNKLTNNFVSANKELELLNRRINILSFQATPYAAIAVNKFAGAVNAVVNFVANTLGVSPDKLGGTAVPSGGGGGGGGGGARGLGSPTPFGAQGGYSPGDGSGAPPRSQPGLGGAPERADKATIGEILQLAARAESNNTPNIMYGGDIIPNLTSMTVQEVLALQNDRYRRGLGTAAGKYQIIPATLQMLIDRRDIRETDMFDVAGQDKAAAALLNMYGYQEYLQGSLTGTEFADRLTKLFASFPMENGRSRYPNNRATISRSDVIDTLGSRYGNILSGPSSGYRATLHGTEAVIPLAGGRSIPIEMPGFNENLRRLGEIMAVQTERLDDLVDMMRMNNNLNKDMLRYQRA
jgi:muramidase (phage lysozyme)